MVTETNPGWKPEDFTPYMKVVFDAFGEDRVMFGSDWPVCLLNGDYKKVYDIAYKFTGKHSKTARSKVFSKNALRFYRDRTPLVKQPQTLQRVDSHQHFWHYSKEEYGWINPETMAPIARSFLPDDLKKAITTAKMNATIAVQARESHEETQMLLDFAAENEHICGVVGWVDLKDPNLRQTLKKYEGN